MHDPTDPWWNQGMLTHPMAASLAVGTGTRWTPSPAPALRVDQSTRAFSVSWALHDMPGADLEIEVVGDMLVLRATHQGQPISRAIPLPQDVDPGRRRDQWRAGKVEVVVPRVHSGFSSRIRLVVARWLRRLADRISPN